MPHRSLLRRLPAALAVALTALLPASADRTGERALPAYPQGQHPVETRLIAHDSSVALRAMRRLTTRGDRDAEEDEEGEQRRIPRFRTTPRAGSGADAARQSLLVARRTPAADVTFEGLAGNGSMLPPDANGDVGPTQYVQAVNNQLAVYSKSGSLLAGTTSAGFWAGLGGPCSTSPEGDPVVLYDQLADRWFVSEFASGSGTGPFYQCVAVSQTPDATGAWYRYSFQVTTTKLPDYPKFGVWPDGYYMAVNQFDLSLPGAPYAGAGVAVFNRTQMLAGAATSPTLMQYIDTGNTAWGGMLPADLDGSAAPPAGAPNPFVQASDPGDQLQLFQFHVDWATPASTTFSLTTPIGVSAYDSTLCGGSTTCVPQPSPGVALDPIAYDQLMFRLQYRNFTGGNAHQSLVVNQTVDAGTNRAALRWYELRNTGSGWVEYQDGTYAPDPDNRFMGSAALNGLGELAVAYTVSGPATRPALRFAGRGPTDSLGLLTLGEGTLYASQGVQTHASGRWGDYSSLTVDPSDDCTFWYTGEYYPATSSATWHTRVGSFRLPLCTTVSVAPPGNVSLPAITGIAQQGQVLTADPGSWSGKQPVTYTYQWLRCSSSCTNVGSGGTTYTLGAGDVGSAIKVAVTGANGIAPSATATSAATSLVTGSGGGTGGPDLAVAIGASPAAPRPGGQLTYKVYVTDTNGVDAPGASVDIVLPSGLQLLASSTDRGSGCAGTGTATLHCSFDTLTVGAPVGIATLETKILAAGIFTLTATAPALAGETVTSNNTATYQVAVAARETFADGSAPAIEALLSVAQRGRPAKLRFKVWDDSNVVRVSLQVRSGSRTVASLGSGYGKVVKGQIYYLPWSARGRLARPLAFCAVALDRSGRTSTRSCAPIRVR